MSTSIENAPNQVPVETVANDDTPVRTCTDCNLEKPDDEFLPSGRAKGRKVNMTRCSSCRLARREAQNIRKDGARAALERAAKKAGLTIVDVPDSSATIASATPAAAGGVTPVVETKRRRRNRGKGGNREETSQGKTRPERFPRVPDTTVVQCQQCEMYLTAASFASDAYAEDGLKTICRYCNRNGDSPTLAPSLDRFAAVTVDLLAKRALRQKVECTLTAEDLLYLLNDQENKCAVTGFFMTTVPKQASMSNFVARNLTVERLNENYGYSVDNVHLVCAMVTLMRNKMTPDEIRTLCRSMLPE